MASPLPPMPFCAICRATGRLSSSMAWIHMAWTAKNCAKLRRKSVAMVYQDPSRALNPSIRIGSQVQEVLRTGGVPRPVGPIAPRRSFRKCASAIRRL